MEVQWELLCALCCGRRPNHDGTIGFLCTDRVPEMLRTGMHYIIYIPAPRVPHVGTPIGSMTPRQHSRSPIELTELQLTTRQCEHTEANKR